MIAARFAARDTRRAWIVMVLLVFIWGYAWVAEHSPAGENRTDDGAGIAAIIAPGSASLSQFL